MFFDSFGLKKISSDRDLAARFHLLKVEQLLCLTKEKLFLLKSTSNRIPVLTANLNLFLDEKEFIRS